MCRAFLVFSGSPLTDRVSIDPGSDAMASWVLECIHCNAIFTHSAIEEGLENYFLPIKPVFPEDGQSMSCPQCGHSARYQSSDLRYQA
jgi:rRNA maturation endonuclease Nob1